VRIDEAVAVIHGDAKVKMVPLAIFYERDKKKAHWSSASSTRPAPVSTRCAVPSTTPHTRLGHPETLSADERAALLAKREELTAAYKKSRRPTYGAVVVRGNAIRAASCPTTTSRRWTNSRRASRRSTKLRSGSELLRQRKTN